MGHTKADERRSDQPDRPSGWGTCCVCTAERRRSTLADSASTFHVPQVVVVATTREGEAEGAINNPLPIFREWSLCRRIGESHRANSTSTFSYDDSIRVNITTPSWEALEAALLDQICRASTVSSAKEWPDPRTHLSQYRHHAKLSPLTDVPKPGCHELASPKTQPAMAMSVAFTAAVSDTASRLDKHSQPLLLAALKRQLAGSVVAFDKDQSLYTEVTLPLGGCSWKLRLVSALGRPTSTRNEHSRSQNQAVFFWILPSTRITIDMIESPIVSTGVDPSGDATIEKTTSGLSKPSQSLIETLNGMLQHPSVNLSRSFLLTGPPGTGKTHAIRIAVQHFQEVACKKVKLISLHGSELMSRGGAPEASQELQRVFEKASRDASRTSVVLIALDECEALVANDTMAGMLAFLLDKLGTEWTRVVFVATTNRVDDIPDFLRRPGRLDKEIILAPPGSGEREVILENLYKKYVGEDLHEHLTPKELHDIADLSVGFVPADLDLLVRRVIEGRSSESSGGAPLFDIFCQFVSTVGASALRDASISAPPKTSWDDVCGDPGGAKTALRQAIEWPRTKRDAFGRLGISAPRGILLHGPPGCAKSSLARAAAGASSVAFLSFSPADVYASSYVGDAEAVVRRGFALARAAAPCVLFFDEIDAILGSNENESPGGGLRRGQSADARVLSTFLNEMDGVDGFGHDGVLVLGATNRPQTLDAALLRPGRFDKVIYVPPPDFDGRRSILDMYCRNWPTVGPFDTSLLASDEVSGGLTGAEIVGACCETASRALVESIRNGDVSLPQMAQCDLEAALRDVRPILSNADAMNDYVAFEQKHSHST